MRKTLKREPLSAEQVRKDARALPEFNKPLAPGRSITDRLSFLWCDGNGKPGKRAFFFSLARIIALGYVIACVIDQTLFIGELAIFIGVVLGETGLNHYRNERNILPRMNLETAPPLPAGSGYQPRKSRRPVGPPPAPEPRIVKQAGKQ